MGDHRHCSDKHHNHSHHHNHKHDEDEIVEEGQNGDVEVPLLSAKEDVEGPEGSGFTHLILKEVYDGDEMAVKLDEHNMWNAAAVGDFAFLPLALPKFPFIVDRFDNDGQSLLHWAALHNNIQAATLLLQNHANVDVLAKKTAQTPLIWACTRGHIQMLNLLFSYGADMNHKDSVGATALIIAVQYKEILTAHYLTNKGMSVSTADNGGCNSLHWAAYVGVVPLLRLFHGKESAADTKDDQGFTPLHRAIFGNCEDAVQFFVENKYDLQVKTKKGDTPLDMAIALKRSPKMVQLLSEASKQRTTQLYQFWNHPKMSLYFFPVLWGVCFFAISYTYYSRLLTYTMESFPMLNMFLGLFLLVHITVYAYVTNSDPGFVGAEARLDFNRIVENLETKPDIDTQRICFTCDIIKPMRSKHCRICDKCVYRFDHHCGWTGNCVGQKNHPAFVAFVVVQEIVHILTVFLCIEALMTTWNSDLGAWSLLDQKLVMLVLLINLVGVVMTGGLVKQHVTMVFNNETTNEVANWARYPHFWKPVVNSEDGRRGLAYTNPFHQGYKTNCEQFCFGTREPAEQKVFAKLDSVYIVQK